MVKRKKLKKKTKKEKIKTWIFYSIIYAFFYSILSGTLSHYFETIPLGLGLMMDVPGFFTMLGLSGWILLTFIIFKGYDLKNLR